MLLVIEPAAWRDREVVELKLSLSAVEFIVNSLQRTSPKDDFTKWLADVYFDNTDDQGHLIEAGLG